LKYCGTGKAGLGSTGIGADLTPVGAEPSHLEAVPELATQPHIGGFTGHERHGHADRLRWPLAR